LSEQKLKVLDFKYQKYFLMPCKSQSNQ